MQEWRDESFAGKEGSLQAYPPHIWSLLSLSWKSKQTEKTNKPSLIEAGKRLAKKRILIFKKMNSAVFGVRLTWLDLKTLWNIPRLYTFYYFSLTCKNNLGDSVIIDFVTVLVFVQVPSVHFNWLDSYPILSILSPFRKDKCHFKLLLLKWKPGRGCSNVG